VVALDVVDVLVLGVEAEVVELEVEDVEVVVVGPEVDRK